MNFRCHFLLAPAALVFGACAIGADPVERPASGLQRVLSVEKVTVRTMESFPEQLHIAAGGTARSGGWTAPELRRVPGGEPGKVTLELVAKPPEGFATQALTPIKAVTTLPKPPGYRGVVVIAETNRKEAR